MKSFMVFCIGFVFLFGCVNPPKQQNSSQEFEVPKNYSFNTDDDYKKYEPEILKCIDYLENAPADDASDYRKSVNSFFLDWLTGTPNVSVTVNSSVTDLCNNNNNFLIIFMTGWTKYSLLNNYDKDKHKGYLAGIESVLKVYRNGNGVEKDQNVSDLIKIQDERKLDEWVSGKI